MPFGGRNVTGACTSASVILDTTIRWQPKAGGGCGGRHDRTAVHCASGSTFLARTSRSYPCTLPVTAERVRTSSLLAAWGAPCRAGPASGWLRVSGRATAQPAGTTGGAGCGGAGAAVRRGAELLCVMHRAAGATVTRSSQSCQPGVAVHGGAHGPLRLNQQHLVRSSCVDAARSTSRTAAAIGGLAGCGAAVLLAPVGATATACKPTVWRIGALVPLLDVGQSSAGNRWLALASSVVMWSISIGPACMERWAGHAWATGSYVETGR